MSGQSNRRELSVSVEFFTGAMKLLVKTHGNREASSLIGDLRDSLAEAEMFYKSMPLITPAKGARKKPTPCKELEYDELYCQHCEKETPHLCRYSDHDRDSSGDFHICQTCKWYYSGLDAKYHPPSEC